MASSDAAGAHGALLGGQPCDEDGELAKSRHRWKC